MNCFRLSQSPLRIRERRSGPALIGVASAMLLLVGGAPMLMSHPEQPAQLPPTVVGSPAAAAPSSNLARDTALDWHVRNKERKFSSGELLKQFEDAESDVYRLGRGDEISVDVWGRAELSGKHQIGPDGRITLPVIGDVMIAEMTRDQAVALLETALGKMYTNVAVTLRVDRYVSNRVFILGRVMTPGALIFDRPPTLLEAITRAGSLPVGGLGAEKAALTRCAVFRGRDEVIWIDLKALMTSADMSLNIRLHRDDLVYLPDADDQLVYVLGEVRSPGAYHMTPDMSLLDGLLRASGPTEDASVDKIHVIRPSRGLNLEFSMKQLLKPDRSLNVSLEEGDILYLPRRTMAKFGYIMQRITPISSLFVVGGSLGK